MPRTPSSVMTDKQKEKAQATAQKAIEMKAALKNAKANAAAAKKAVAESQKDFTSEPSTGSSKLYQSAVKSHVSAVLKVDKLAAKIAA